MSSLYAIIRTSGRQYHVRQGTVIEVAQLDAKPGEELALSDILLLGDSEGGALHMDASALKAAKVRARILAHGSGPKLRVVKFRRRKNYRRTIGHRQPLTRLEIMAVESGQAAPAADEQAAPAAGKTDATDTAAPPQSTPPQATPPQAQTETGEQHGT